MDSMFNLQRPYDLVALLKQEQRAVMLENLKQELLSRKADIDGNEDKDTGRCTFLFIFLFISQVFASVVFDFPENVEILNFSLNIIK